MSILQTISQDASAILKGRVTVDWPGYAKACHEIAERHVDPVERALNRKRAYALKYLETESRNKGGSYNKDAPSVFTPQLIAELGAANSVRRAKRNPRLESMLGSIKDNHEMKFSVDHGNILSFGPQITACSQSSTDVLN